MYFSFITGEKRTFPSSQGNTIFILHVQFKRESLLVQFYLRTLLLLHSGTEGKETNIISENPGLETMSGTIQPPWAFLAPPSPTLAAGNHDIYLDEDDSFHGRGLLPQIS